MNKQEAIVEVALNVQRHLCTQSKFKPLLTILESGNEYADERKSDRLIIELAETFVEGRHWLDSNEELDNALAERYPTYNDDFVPDLLGKLLANIQKNEVGEAYQLPNILKGIIDALCSNLATDEEIISHDSIWGGSTVAPGGNGFALIGGNGSAFARGASEDMIQVVNSLSLYLSDNPVNDLSDIEKMLTMLNKAPERADIESFDGSADHVFSGLSMVLTSLNHIWKTEPEGLSALLEEKGFFDFVCLKSGICRYQAAGTAVIGWLPG